MNIYGKIYSEELQNQIKSYEELCDLIDRQVRDFEKMTNIDPPQFSPIVAGLLRKRKLFLPFYDFLQQLNYHLKRGD